MQSPPQIFERRALLRYRTRASRDPATFLREAVLDDVKERLNDVNRRFTSPAVVTAHPGLWAEVVPDARLVPDDEVLDLAEAEHDLVIHDMTLHAANDPVGQLVQARRALVPDGLLIATLFGGQTLAELRAALAEAEALITGGISPRIFPMAEIRDLGALLQRAGLALPVADSWNQSVIYPDAFALMRDLRAMGEANALAGRQRRPTRRTILQAAADIYAHNWGTPDGRTTATFEVITLTGWAPAEDQPKPLRPGSATHRLADFLKTTETPLDPRGH